MIAADKDRVRFHDYITVLDDLENAFRLAGEKIEFRLGLFDGTEPYVEILRRGKRAGVQFITGDSPAQAIKDVANAVRL
jgi:hypothetical protein